MAVDRDTRLRRAREDLERHRDRMVQMWGEDYTADPEYAKALAEVADEARYPALVIADRLRDM